jgi:hypothetical protein
MRNTGSWPWQGPARSTPMAIKSDIKWVELTAGGDDHSHLIEPDDIIHMLLTRQ